MKTLEDLIVVIQAGLKNWPKDQGELKFAKSCSNLDDFINKAPLDILVWVATQLDRETVHSHTAWEVYSHTLNEASLSYMPISDKAMRAYQVEVESLCMLVLVRWARG